MKVFNLTLVGPIFNVQGKKRDRIPHKRKSEIVIHTFSKERDRYGRRKVIGTKIIPIPTEFQIMSKAKFKITR